MHKVIRIFMCGDLNELAGVCVCLCHGWYYSGDGRNGNRVDGGVAQIQHGTWNLYRKNQYAI